MRFYATEQLGPTQSKTPEGYLLCQGVAIARTGSQTYAGAELKELIPSIDGLIKVIREESEVFRPETLASFEGKSVTIDHNFVDPDTWRELTVGTVQNVRRGEGDRIDLVLADLLITDANAIELVQVKKDAYGMPIPGDKPLRDVSCGYEADYVQDGPGVAYQRNIIGNHVALVERGRAGPRCSIQDGDISMATTNKETLLKRLLRAVRMGDADQIAAAMEDAEDETPEEKAEREAKEKGKKTEDAVSKLVATVDGLTKIVAKLVKDAADPEESEEDKKKRMEDEANEEAGKIKTGDSLREITSRAEILVPGLVLPTMDGTLTSATLVTARRHVLREAMKTADGRTIVASLIGASTVDSLDASAVGTVFVAATEMARTRNNAKSSTVSMGVKTGDFGKAPSIADMNARNAEFWKTN
jgi:hypothetical protein